MKRDYDYLRELMFEIEEKESHQYIFPLLMSQSREEQKKHHHLSLLCDKGFLEQLNDHVYRMTSAGHDFIESVRDGGIWEKTKVAVAETGGNASIELINRLAQGYLKKKIAEHTGLEL